MLVWLRATFVLFKNVAHVKNFQYPSGFALPAGFSFM